MRHFKIILLGFLFLATSHINGQELNATIDINTQKISGTNKNIFENLKKTLTEFVNEHSWTNQKYAQNEKIKCSFSIIVNKYTESTGHFECDAYIQSVRPVFNTSYSTTTLSMHDKKFDFDFHEFDQLNYNDEQIENNLTALFAYYCYLITGIDMDTMAPMGGTDILQKAMNVANNAQSLNTTGWKAFDDVSNRFGIINDYIAEAMLPLRQLQYIYHRKGLDQMSENVEAARDTISAALTLLQKAYTNKPLSTLPLLFTEYKREELVGIFKGQGTSQQKQPIYDILIKLNAAQSSYWKELLN